MKLNDLMEAEQLDLGFGEDEGFGELTASLPEVVDALRKFMNDTKTSLESSQTDNTSHSLGGNLSANVSGLVEIRAPYVQPGAYNTSIKWDAALLIGNNIPDALTKVKRVYHELEGILHGFHVPLQADHDDVAHFKFDDNTTISINYNHARNFCTALYRVSKR